MKKSYKKKAVRVDINQKITNLFLDQLKAGVAPLQQTYQETDFREFTSFYSEKSYKGINIVLLWLAKQANQLQSNGFLTFNQATEIAGISSEQIKDARDKSKPKVTLQSINHPLAGQKSIGFVVYQSPLYKDKNGATWIKKEKDGNIRKEPTSYEIRSEGIKQIWTSNSHSVWSVDQMSNIPQKWLEKRNNAGTIINKDVNEGTQNERLRELAQNLIKKNGIKVVTGESPDYDEKRDVIVMPKINDFVSDSSFYRSLIHQLVHWTGHKDRLNRDFDKTYGENSNIENIAQEELIAEMGSAFMCQKSGLDSFTSSNLEYHTSMMSPWIGLLENNNKALVFAASKAEKSVDYLIKSLDNELVLDKENSNDLKL
jgi:antirestriction protein ArdC